MGVAKKDDPLDALRPLMAAYDPPLSAIVIPSEDAHQSEYVADRDKRRSFVSGFTGSAGLAVVTQTDALLWTDGRYFLQAEQQLSSRWKLMRIGEDLQVENWLADNLPSGGTVGVDPWCISVSNAQRWEDVLSKRGQKLIQCHQNLVDIVWEDRPSEKICPVVIHPVQFTGRTTKEKLHDLRTKMQQEKAFAMVVSALDEVAWLYNLRGNDVLYNPVVHSFAIVTVDAAYYYVDNRKVGTEVTNYLKENDIVIKTYDEILQDLEALVSSHHHPAKGPGMEADGPVDSDEAMPQQVTKNETKENEKGTATSCNMIWIDPNTCNLMIYSKLPAERVTLQQSPIAISKALKHPVELEGLRNSHIRDGAAVVSYMAWLDQQMKDIYGAAGYFSESKPSNKRKCSETERLTEVSVSDKLEEFRAKQQYFRGLSFETISSVGANAAVIHYAPSADNCAEMLADAIYLCDSGGQYLDGTTDVTRTMHFGKPTPHERSCFTQVLKGHIALDTVVFPSGTTGHALDILARVPLWMSGLDYRHGTGHGVGCYLNVHEGPHLISFRPQARNVPLQATMTVTDEPGYYEDGNFGIRLENVLIVKEAETEHNFGDKGYLGFEHITWVPFQVKMIDLSLLTASEKAWVDKYHEECRQKLAPLLSGCDLEWLVKATEALP